MTAFRRVYWWLAQSAGSLKGTKQVVGIGRRNLGGTRCLLPLRSLLGNACQQDLLVGDPRRQICRRTSSLCCADCQVRGSPWLNTTNRGREERVCIDGLGGDPDQREPIVPMCGLAWEGADSSLVWCLADLAQIYCNGQGTVRGRS